MPRRGKRKPWEPERIVQGGRKHKEKRYNTQRWKRLRLFVLKRSPLCVECGAAAQVVDHITPARVAPDLFYDIDNLAPMCHPCHNRKSATTDKQAQPPVQPPDGGGA